MSSLVISQPNLRKWLLVAYCIELTMHQSSVFQYIVPFVPLGWSFTEGRVAPSTFHRSSMLCILSCPGLAMLHSHFLARPTGSAGPVTGCSRPQFVARVATSSTQYWLCSDYAVWRICDGTFTGALS